MSGRGQLSFRPAQMEAGGRFDDDLGEQIASDARVRERRRWLWWLGAAVLALLVLTNPHVSSIVGWVLRTLVNGAARAFSGAAKGRHESRFKQNLDRGSASSASQTGLMGRGPRPSDTEVFERNMQAALDGGPCISSVHLSPPAPDPAVLLADGALLLHDPTIVRLGGGRKKLNEESLVCKRAGVSRREKVEIAHGPSADRRLLWLSGDVALCVQHAIDALAGRCDDGAAHIASRSEL